MNKHKMKKSQEKPSKAAQRPSEDRILYGDIPSADNGYCPFPKEVWPQVDRRNYYKALNYITDGILTNSPSLHFAGLRRLFEMGEEYDRYVKINWAPKTSKNIYYAIHSGTGNFDDCALWIPRDIIQSKQISKFYDSDKLIAVMAHQEFSPNNYDAENEGRWVRVQDYGKPFSKAKGIVALRDFSKNVFDDMFNSKNIDSIYLNSLTAIVKDYEAKDADFWKMSDYFASLEKGLTDSPIPKAVKKGIYWIGSEDDLDKLYEIWTDPRDPMIVCSREDFLTRMYGDTEKGQIIVWLKTARVLACWLGTLSGWKRIGPHEWVLAPSIFKKNNSSKAINADSLRAMIADRDKFAELQAIQKKCEKAFPLPFSLKK